MGSTLKRIFALHPIFEQSPKTAAIFAKRLIFDESLNISTVPTDIQRMMQKEITKAAKSKVKDVLNDLKVEEIDDLVDFDQNVHHPHLDEMKQKWMKEMEAKFESVHGQKWVWEACTLFG